MAERYVHEKIKNIEIAVPDEYGDDLQNMVKDPIEETAVVINITINRYTTTTTTTTTQSSTAAVAAGDPEEEEEEEEELDDDPTDHLYVLDGFLGDDISRWDELNGLVHGKIVTAATLKEIKKTIMEHSSRIKTFARQLKTEAIGIDMTLDLLTWYSDEQEDVVDDDEEDEEEMSDQDDEDEEEMSDQDDDMDDDDDGVEEEEMIDIEDDNNDVNSEPALRSSVLVLETRTFENKEDLEMMLKSSTGSGCRSCGVCLEEFSIDVAAGGISIKTMPCLHIFHTGCIEPWLEKTYTCPICRYKMPTLPMD